MAIENATQGYGVACSRCSNQPPYPLTSHSPYHGFLCESLQVQWRLPSHIRLMNLGIALSIVLTSLTSLSSCSSSAAISEGRSSTRLPNPPWRTCRAPCTPCAERAACPWSSPDEVRRAGLRCLIRRGGPGSHLGSVCICSHLMFTYLSPSGMVPLACSSFPWRIASTFCSRRCPPMPARSDQWASAAGYRDKYGRKCARLLASHAAFIGTPMSVLVIVARPAVIHSLCFPSFPSRRSVPVSPLCALPVIYVYHTAVSSSKPCVA